MAAASLTLKTVVGAGADSILVEPRGGSIRLKPRGGPEVFIPWAVAAELGAALAELSRRGELARR